MKTLYIHGSADHYGSAKVLLDIIQLSGKAANAMVVLPHDGLLVRDLQSIGVKVQIMNLGVLRRKYFTPWGMTGRVILWLVAIVRLRKIIHKEKIGRIYINSANVIIGPFLKTTHTELVWHIHEIVEKPALLRNLLGKLFCKADRLLTVSAATQLFWKQQTGSDRFQLLYNGIDTARFTGITPNREKYCPAAKKDDVVIGMIGRVQAWKGQEYFLEIMEQYFAQADPSNGQQVYGCMAGDPYPGYEKLAEELKGMIRERGLTKKVFYNGYVDHTPEWMASIDILVLPSVKPDPLPTVILEAMASGKPVIATHQGGALEMIEKNETGYFIPLQDVASAAKTLASLIKDEGTRKRMGEKGKERVSKLFSRQAFAENWHRILHS